MPAGRFNRPERRAMSFVLAIDQGTTSSRAIVFDRCCRPRATARRDLVQHYPADGWVEHDAGAIWQDTLGVCREAIAGAGLAGRDIAAIGITNQRETTVLWERASGRPLARAIVWQDRRTAPACRALIASGAEPGVRSRTGLLLDPYFSATKLAWLLDHLPGARARAERGELCFGTIDSYLLFRLTGGRVHATDASNAARTLLFNLTSQNWDPELLRLFDIPAPLLPEVRDTICRFGETDPALFGAAIPITGIAGDQQAAAFGQACFEPGMIKCTYGTGGFALMTLGDTPRLSEHRLLTTVAWRLGGTPTFALEGSIFVAGAAVQWLRDGLGLIADSAASEDHARRLDDTGGVYLVPAFTGLGAPYWDPDARGALLGLTRNTGASHLVRAGLEAVAYQSRDLMEAMAADAGRMPAALRVDGGMVGNDWLMQFLADILDLPVERPALTETTALGAACLAGLGAGVYGSLAALAAGWQCQKRFAPGMTEARRTALYLGWQRAVARVRS